MERSSATEKCATHGLAYDPTRASGCVLCMRLVTQSQAPVQRASIPWAYMLAGVVAVGGMLAWIIPRLGGSDAQALHRLGASVLEGHDKVAACVTQAEGIFAD